MSEADDDLFEMAVSGDDRASDGGMGIGARQGAP
jgi:hypothetical protein